MSTFNVKPLSGASFKREIARNMNIPEGTVLARAKREGWTREIQNAKALAKREDAPAVTICVAVLAHIGNGDSDESVVILPSSA